MSKVDALRALREARYAAAQKGQPPARHPLPDAASKGLAKKAGAKTQGARADKVILDEAVELCGHRAISGKSCIRPADHSEKTHRYPKS